MKCSDGNTYPCGYRGNENMGKFWELDFEKTTTQPFCKQCEWECFRDPSVMLGPVLDLRKTPLKLIGKMLRNKEFFSIWFEDLRYYNACEFFDGRRMPNWKKLARFSPEKHRQCEVSFNIDGGRHAPVNNSFPDGSKLVSPADKVCNV